MNQSGTVRNLREKLYSSVQFAEVNNFSALRFGLFSKAIGPCCVIYCTNEEPNDAEPITYLCPKNSDWNRIRIEPADWKELYQSQLSDTPWIWTALMWGDFRSIELINKLERNTTNLQSLMNQSRVKSREGIIRGNRQRENPAIVGRHIVTKSREIEQLKILTKSLPINENALFDGATSTDFSAFKLPQLIVKQSWTTKLRRFIAAKVEPSSKNEDGILCSDSYVSVHSEDEELLWRIWLSFNSCVSVWWQLLRSGRFSSYIPQPLEFELRAVPIPKKLPVEISKLSDYSEIDRIAKKSFSLSDEEWALVRDIFEFTLADFKDGESSVGRRSTVYEQSDPLIQYAEWLMKVFEAGMGHRNFSATIFQTESSLDPLPIRLIGIHLGSSAGDGKVDKKLMSDPELLDLIGSLYTKIINPPSQQVRGFCIERHLRIYDHFEPERSTEVMPTVFIAKPDRRSVWTRTAAMRDADEILEDIIRAQAQPDTVTE